MTFKRTRNVEKSSYPGREFSGYYQNWANWNKTGGKRKSAELIHKASEESIITFNASICIPLKKHLWTDKEYYLKTCSFLQMARFLKFKQASVHVHWSEYTHINQCILLYSALLQQPILFQ